MYVVNESEKEFRFGDSGPKYLMKGPRSSFAIVRFNPGQDFGAHFHQIMEEDFYILEGKVDIYVNESKTTLEPGQFMHVEPGEVHYVRNPYEKPVSMISSLAPYQIKDKTEAADFIPVEP